MIVKDVAFVAFSGATPPTIIKAAGVVVARTGTGVYTMTLGVAVAAADAAFSTKVSGGGVRIANIANTSDTVKTLTVSTDAGAASDDFTISVLFQQVLGGGVGGG